MYFFKLIIIFGSVIVRLKLFLNLKRKTAMTSVSKLVKEIQMRYRAVFCRGHDCQLEQITYRSEGFFLLFLQKGHMTLKVVLAQTGHDVVMSR